MHVLASFDWAVLWDNRGEFESGFWKTLEVSASAIAGAFVVGIVLGASRAHRLPVVSWLAAIYVEVIRNTPILVQAFFIFFGLPQITSLFFGTLTFKPILLSPFTAAWLTLVIWGGAFNTENFRAGFEAVPQRYREAGRALGFSRRATFLNITLPIGGRIALPSSINTCVSVLKNSALIGPAISFPELTEHAYSVETVTFRAPEVFFALAVIYLTVVWTLSALIRLLEARLALPEARRVRLRRQIRPGEAV